MGEVETRGALVVVENTWVLGVGRNILRRGLNFPLVETGVDVGTCEPDFWWWLGSGRVGR